MTLSLGAAYPAAAFPPRRHPRASAMTLIVAGYDLMLATLIIVAGSQGTYRFVPTLLLWAMVYVMIALKFALHQRGLVPVLRDNVTIFAFPAVAFLSATWSLEPSHSVYSAAQLAVTYLCGVWIGWRYRPREIALVIILALSPVVALSLVNWKTGMFGEVYSYAGGLLGVFGNKNTLGRMALLLGLAAMGLMLTGRQRPLNLLALGGVAAMAALAIVLSKSATSALFMAGAAGLLVLLTMHHYRAKIRLALFALTALSVPLVCAIIAFGNFDPAKEVLDLFGKSSTLTGRTFLWDVAVRQIDMRPWFGVGFDAYWDSGMFPAADKIQLMFGDGLISFHNFILDIMVGMGLAGLAGIVVTLGTIGLCYLRLFSLTRGVDAALMLAVLFAAIGVALFNPLLHGQHGNMIIILIALAVSARIERRETGGAGLKGGGSHAA